MSRRFDRSNTALGLRSWAAFLVLLIPSLLLAGCAGTASDPGQQLSPLATAWADSNSLSALPTATPPLSMVTLPPLTVGQPSFQLLVLHTNDNWGETEPCG
jgi:hypothetical protein